MRAEIVPLGGRDRNAVYAMDNTRHFRLYGEWDNFSAVGLAQRFQHALAAHDAELDKTRFVELTEQNKQLSTVLGSQLQEERDANAKLRLQLCRIRAAGPGDIEAAIRILQKHRDIQNCFVETPMLREQLKEAQEKYANLRMEIKNLL